MTFKSRELNYSISKSKTVAMVREKATNIQKKKVILASIALSQKIRKNGMNESW